MSTLLSLVITNEDSTTVIAVEGEIDVSSVAELENALNRHLGDSSHLVLDLSRVTFMDSSGIHALIDADAVSRDHECGFAIRNPARAVRRILEIAGVWAQLPIEA